MLAALDFRGIFAKRIVIAKNVAIFSVRVFYSNLTPNSLAKFSSSLKNTSGVS